MKEERKRSNRRIGLTLGLVAAVFFLGIVARVVVLGS